ncbi:hypothetical protein IAR55_003217 [Kwoniella newhampshirensis]|uniref:Uncharacterized protein n=1 Tax=Kwoniella newhampshirensis TaxID=1651941 RepID=A0AAW0YM22_9TREE
MFRWHDCSEGHIILGLFFSLSSLVCLILTTFSTPFIRSFYFLSVPPSTSNGGTTRFGSFGWCTLVDGGADAGCTPEHVGYDWMEGGEVIGWLTRTMILFGIAALFMLLALITLVLSLLKVGKFMWNPVYFRTTALLGSLVSILAEIFALILWVNARHRFDRHNNTDATARAKYGAALWTGLIGATLSFLAAAIGGPAYQGRFMYRAARHQAYNV